MEVLADQKHIAKSNVLNKNKWYRCLQATLRDIQSMIKTAGRPLEMVWETSPSRSVSPYAKEIIANKKYAEEELRNFFDTIDTDKSGTITKKELLKSLRGSSVLSQLAEKYPALRPLLHVKKFSGIFEEIDVDESGDLTFDELLTFIRSKSKRLRFQRELEQKIGKRNTRRGQRKSELLPIREAKLSWVQARSLHDLKTKLLPSD